MIKPMLAQKINENKIDWSGAVYMQPKLDGVRCIFTKDGAFSRTGRQFKNVAHIEKDLNSFFQQHPTKILDGELYNHELKNDFEKIISLVRKLKPTKQHREDAKNLMQYHVYDYISGESYGIRHANLVCSDIYNEHIKYVETLKMKNIARARRQHDRFLSRGYEGSILRLDKKYVSRRSWHLMKFKDFSDAEATITGWEEGKGKRVNTLGKFIMTDDEGNVFGCPPGRGYNYADLRTIMENIHDYIGKRATFTYFERTKAGSYRHPLFKGLRNYE